MARRVCIPRFTKVTAAVLLAAVLAVLTPCAIEARPAQCPDRCLPGRYSAEAAQADSGREGYTAGHPIYSPDRRKAFRIEEDHWWLEVNGKKITPQQDLMDWPWVEIGWAPDSRTFFITHSGGYTTGYRLDLYRLEGERIRALADVTRLLQKDFDLRHKCYDPATRLGNDPNIAGLKWMDGSNDLLVVAEVPNVGICPQMAYFGGYRVSAITGKILGRYSPAELWRRWKKDFGENLLSDLHYMSRARKSTTP